MVVAGDRLHEGTGKSQFARKSESGTEQHRSNDDGENLELRLAFSAFMMTLRVTWATAQ